MNYKTHKMDIIFFEENDDLVKTLSGDEGGTGGNPGSSAFSYRQDI